MKILVLLIIIPTPSKAFFYHSNSNLIILDGVIFGIGVALGLECWVSTEITGLGLAGAIVINFCGRGALLS